ncbi:MAG: hypothetical protein ABR573_05950 [Candidatus Dormibacteria bacterium]
MKRAPETSYHGVGDEAGSLLGVVMIVLAVLAITGAALLAESSSHLLIARAAATRISHQATLDSAVEYAINQLQSANAACGTSWKPTPPNADAVTVTYSCVASPATFPGSPFQPLDHGTTTTVTTLATALVAAPTVALAVNALPQDLSSGSVLTLTSGAHTDTVTLSAVALANSVAVPVNSFTPSFAYPVGTTVALTKAGFNYDGTELKIPGTRTDYVLSDANGVLYDYPWGSTSAIPTGSTGGGWTFNAGVPPAFSPVGSGASGLGTQGSIFLPGNQVSSCGGSTASCLQRIDEPASGNPTGPACTTHDLPSSDKTAKISSQPAMGISAPTNVYLGFDNGWVFAVDGTAKITKGIKTPECQQQGSSVNSSAPAQGTAAVVAGPFVGEVTETTGTNVGTWDNLYVVENITIGSSKGAYLLRYECSAGGGNNCGANKLLYLQSVQALTTGDAVGMSVLPGPGTTQLPARVLIVGSAGEISLLGINSSGGITANATASVPSPAGTTTAPSWCAAPVCDPVNDQFAVASSNGNLYLFNAGTSAAPSLSLVSTYSSGAAAGFKTRPAADPYGDWFVGAENGKVYILPAGASSFLSFASGGTNAIRSSPVIDTCSTNGICIYMGTTSTDDTAYLLKGTAAGSGRTGDLFACLGSSACSSSNFGLWSEVRILTGLNPSILSWSYASSP